MPLDTDKAARENAYLRVSDLRGDLRLLCEAHDLYLRMFPLPEANQFAQRLFDNHIVPLQKELADTILRSLGVDCPNFVPQSKRAPKSRAKRSKP